MCVTLDSTSPASNGSGTACTTGWALSPVASGESEYNGYFDINQSVTVKIIAGVNGETDSSIVSYGETPTQSVLAANFGWQCGPRDPSNCPTETWPSYLYVPDTFRLWDTLTSWSEIVQTSTCLANNDCVWTILDNYLIDLNNHLYNGQPRFAIFTNGYVPCWEVGLPTNCGSGNAPHGQNAIPNDLTSSGSSPGFNAFITAFVNHCVASQPTICVKNLITGYELWNEWNTGVYWTNCGNLTQCGTKLCQMWVPAAQIIRASVPHAVLIAPSATPANANYLTAFSDWLNMENSSGRISDAANWHLYMTNLSPPPYTNTPESQWTNVAPGIISDQNGIAGWKSAPYLDTETNFIGNGSGGATPYGCASTDYPTADCAGQIARWQIMHASNGVASLDWYSGNRTIGNGPASYQDVYQYAQQFMIGGHFTAAASNLSGSVWTAPFVEANGTVALWVWQSCTAGDNACESGTTYTVPANYTDYRDLVAGGVTDVIPGNPISISVMPIMLEQVYAAAPTFNPPGGTYTGTQNITVSTTSTGAIICGNTTGSPKTNGSTGCAAGSTLYTGPIQLKSGTNVTLYAVAGGSGFNDSPISSATYVIH